VKADRPYLAHIADTIAAIETDVVGGRESFLRERLVQDAVIRNFEIIGEAAGRLSPRVRQGSDISWSKVTAFRNRIIHGYWNVDARLVRDVIGHELPALKAAVQQRLADQPPG
jgi:uncharacterized protein with HEPN domain